MASEQARRLEMPVMSSHLRENGAALIVCLLLMVVILLLATSGAQIAIQEERASRYERDRLVAFVAAEAALRDAEQDIERTGRVEAFEKMEGVPGTCETGLSNPLLGLCHPAPLDMFPVWQKIELAMEPTSVPLGYFTGGSMAPSESAAPPAYLVEVISEGDAGKSAPGRRLYRVTAIGYGVSVKTQVVLQSYFGKSSDGRWQREGWREVLNWEEIRETVER